ncbi:MAG TPA: phosphonopyruvate decarboxylase [Spirochaetota bacterium]|nr:phosphonopyruvate decarboxylase [Spirochaetota bacterium]HPN82059.1 phosphonopyruvate decarboxylase [Spirochaetota bacterium]
MLQPADLYAMLRERGIDLFAGVPDSLLANFCAYVTDHAPAEENIITANEGAAVALACGHYLATGRPGLVYMQNSGEGNAVNPLLSLADPDVYGLPVLLVIGWRGEPGVHDEPQHVKQGKVTLSLLETMGIPYEVLPDQVDGAKASLDRMLAVMRGKSCPVALVIKKGVFDKYKLQKIEKTSYELDREGAVKLVVDQLDSRDVVVSTTGKTSRELFEYREALKQGHGSDFLTVGSMGHAVQIALGIALAKKDRQVFCFDGDGAVIMQMGSLPVTASLPAKNLKHIVFNNGAHDSVGGQPTVGFRIDLCGIAKASGYRHVESVETTATIREAMGRLRAAEGPAFLEIRVNKGGREDLGRPTTTTIENRDAFMKFLSE